MYISLLGRDFPYILQFPYPSTFAEMWRGLRWWLSDDCCHWCNMWVGTQTIRSILWWGWWWWLLMLLFQCWFDLVIVEWSSPIGRHISPWAPHGPAPAIRPRQPIIIFISSTRQKSPEWSACGKYKIEAGGQEANLVNLSTDLPGSALRHLLCSPPACCDQRPRCDDDEMLLLLLLY